MTVQIETLSDGVKTSSFLWSNVLDHASLAASTEAVDGAGMNSTDEATWDFWLPTAVPATLTVNRAFVFSCDCAGIAAHNLGTVGATVRVQSSLDGVTWVTESTCTPTDDSTIMMFFPKITRAWWRLRVTDAIATIGVVFIGEKIDMPVTPLSGHTSLHNAKSIELMNSGTDGGHFRGNRIIRRGAETNINFGAVDTVFADGANFQGFKDHYNEGFAFFYAGCPSIYPNDVGYCWRPEGASEIRPNYIEAGILSEISLQVASYVA